MNCLKCGDIIPIRVLIDNKIRILNKRKYCLSCSPFGMHNTRKIVVGCKDPKHCKVCDKPLPSRRRNICNACHVAKYRQNIKRKLVEYKGGKCIVCGYNEYIGSLTFHHREPTKKEFQIGGQSRSFEKLKNEVDKCELVCHNCHGEIHGGIITI